MEAGQIAKDLATLYSYLIEQICVANAERNTGPIDTCIDVLQTVREAWEQIPDTEKPNPAPETAAPPAPATTTAAAERRSAGLSLKA
jgi:flagellin-specific chaperone FliS